MTKLYLVNTLYDNDKNRIIIYFSKDPSTDTYDLVYKEKFNPSLYIDLADSLIKNLLIDFKKEIIIKRLEENKTQVFCKNYDSLKKVAKIIGSSTYKNIILIEPERQYLIEKDWSYYDCFLYLGKSQIKKIEESQNINNAIKKYVKLLDNKQQIKLMETVSKKIILSNFLKIKPFENIKNDQIMNILFENNFFNKKLVLKNKAKAQYNIQEKNIKNSINLNFSNIWPYLLQKKFYNISYETINCSCCKPDNVFETNTLSSSLVEVKFLQEGYYFISKDREWSNKYHKENEKKQNRINYLKINKIKQLPSGPFNKEQIERIPLIDATNLLENQEIKLLNNHNLSWYCKNKESFVSEIVSKIKNRLISIEMSINLSNSFTYLKKLNTENLEYNPKFALYFTEYKLLSDLLEEIPKFMIHRNTKFYDPKIESAIKNIKLETLEKIDHNHRAIINNQKITTKDKGFVKKVNNYFPKIDLPIPKLITG